MKYQKPFVLFYGKCTEPKKIYTTNMKKILVMMNIHGIDTKPTTVKKNNGYLKFRNDPFNYFRHS